MFKIINIIYKQLKWLNKDSIKFANKMADNIVKHELIQILITFYIFLFN